MIMIWHVHLPPAPSNQFDDKVPTKADNDAVMKKSIPHYYPPSIASLESGSMVYSGGTNYLCKKLLTHIVAVI